MKVAVLALLAVVSCAPRISKPISAPVLRGSYAYQEMKKGEYFIWAADDKAYAAAKKEIGCGICREEPHGTIMQYRVLKFTQPAK